MLRNLRKINHKYIEIICIYDHIFCIDYFPRNFAEMECLDSKIIKKIKQILYVQVPVMTSIFLVSKIPI